MHLARSHIRYIGAAAAATMAAIYYLIGLDILDIGGTTTGQATDSFGFGLSAGTVFLLTAGLLVFTDRRWIWVAATIFQLLVYVTYVGASAIREPAFETWGITLRIVQLPLLMALIYLSVRAPHVAARASLPRMAVR